MKMSLWLRLQTMEGEAVMEDPTEHAGHEETHQNEDEFVASIADKVEDEAVIEDMT